METVPEHFGDILVTFEGQIGSFFLLLETDREVVGRWGQIGSISGTSWEHFGDKLGMFRRHLGSISGTNREFLCALGTNREDFLTSKPLLFAWYNNIKLRLL